MVSPKQWSPSFVAAVTLLIAAVVGYIAWNVWSPSGVSGSEQVVREFASATAKEVGPFRRKLRRLTNAATMTAEERAAAIEEIESSAAEVRERIDQLADEASAQIEEMGGISVKTQDNRIGRIESRATEAKNAIAVAVKDATASLNPPPP